MILGTYITLNQHSGKQKVQSTHDDVDDSSGGPRYFGCGEAHEIVQVRTLRKVISSAAQLIKINIVWQHALEQVLAQGDEPLRFKKITGPVQSQKDLLGRTRTILKGQVSYRTETLI